VVKEMIMRTLLAIVLVVPALAEAGVRHVPPASAIAGAGLELVAEAVPDAPMLAVHYRAPGATTYATLELVRDGDRRWSAVVPAAEVTAPGLEYYLAADGAPVFASPRSPHVIRVDSSADDERRARDLLRTAGRRSRIRTAGELVSYGTRIIDGARLIDRYYRVDADFSYRLWAYPLEELRVGYTRLVGESEVPVCDAAPRCTAEVGYKVAGWFELGLAPVEGLRLDGRAMVMATTEGFAIGGRAEARLGAIDGSHVALGVEHMADVGTAGYFRLGWGTVPALPMAATVEVTNLPVRTSDTGVRLYYDIARELGGGVRIGARVGYAARNQTVAGFTGGGNVAVEF
jgi:hypothetical protein